MAKGFMDEEFLLTTKTARELYHNYAAKMPVFDFHNHLSAKEIYENKKYENLAKLWLGGDHYKWRALRALGIEETYITGEASPYEKFRKWAAAVPELIGTPLYHWTHLELQRYFGIKEPLSEKNAEKVWKKTEELLKKEEYGVRGLLKQRNVTALCTTDDPVDTLEYHKALKDEKFEIQVLPTYRPDQILNIEKETFLDYVNLLAKTAGYAINVLEDVKRALAERLDYFVECGCVASDHSVSEWLYEKTSGDEAEAIFQKRLQGILLTEKECRKYHGHMLTFLGREYAKRNLVMQLHIGAIRNNSARMFEKLGTDAGFDSVGDFLYANQLGGLLNELDYTDELPKTILYNLNPRDNLMLAAMAGNFQGGGIPGKIQFGTAWWFCDNLQGINAQLDALCQVGVLSGFVGMVTDSRSFLSFPRHEYFRRILCEYIGQLVKKGQYPKDMEYLGRLAENISYYNAKRYFHMDNIRE